MLKGIALLLMALLIVGSLLLSRLMALFTIFDLFKSFGDEAKLWDMYDDARAKRRRDDF
jgi:hypothetical protein